MHVKTKLLWIVENQGTREEDLGELRYTWRETVSIHSRKVIL